MQIIEHTLDFQLPPCRVIIGKFDGIHLGHKRLLDCFSKTEDSLPKAMITFDFSVATDASFEREQVLFTREERLYLAEEFGMDYVVFLPFTDAIRCMSPEAFIEELLIRGCHAKAVYVGEDFRFGCKRAGDAAYMKRICEMHAVQCEIAPVYEIEHSKVSSTRLRDCLMAGEFASLRAMLGYPYFIQGTVVHGKEIGRTMGFPTMNLQVPADKLLPAKGVYSSVCIVDGQAYLGITNIGDNPTVRDGLPHALTVETYALDYAGDAYGKKSTVFLMEAMRPQRTFANLAELTAQLHADKAQRREMSADLGMLAVKYARK